MPWSVSKIFETSVPIKPADMLFELIWSHRHGGFTLFSDWVDKSAKCHFNYFPLFSMSLSISFTVATLSSPSPTKGRIVPHSLTSSQQLFRKNTARLTLAPLIVGMLLREVTCKSKAMGRMKDRLAPNGWELQKIGGRKMKESLKEKGLQVWKFNQFATGLQPVWTGQTLLMRCRKWGYSSSQILCEDQQKGLGIVPKQADLHEILTCFSFPLRPAVLACIAL